MEKERTMEGKQMKWLEYYKGKTVLVTGHTGFKGSWLCVMLEMAGAKVVGYALPPEKDAVLFDCSGVAERMVSVEGDIRDRAHLLEVFHTYQPQVVFHLAAQPIVRTSYEQPVYTYETNVMGTVNLLECVRNTPGVQSVLMSLQIKYTKIKNGSGGIVRMIRWMVLIPIPTASPVPSW